MGSEALSAVNEEDILAAWGIARSELEKRKQSASSASQAEPDQPRETPTSKHTRVYYITRVEKKDAHALRKQSETQAQTVDYDRTDYTLIKQALGMEKAEAWTPDVDMPEFEAVTENRVPKFPKRLIRRKTNSHISVKGRILPQTISVGVDAPG